MTLSPTLYETIAPPEELLWKACVIFASNKLSWASATLVVISSMTACALIYSLEGFGGGGSRGGKTRALRQ